MKRIGFIIMLLVVCHATIAQINLYQGLILRLPFDGSFSDASSNGLTVTPFNAPVLTTDKFGNIGSALLLDGIDDYLEVSTPNGELSPRNAMSFFLRFRTSSTNLQTLLGKVGYTTAKDKEYQVAIHWSAQPGALYGLSTTNNTDCNTSTPLFDDYVKTGMGTINLLAWHCLAGTYDGTSLKIYLDGILKDSLPVIGLVDSCSNPPLRIGKWWVNDNQTFSGAIDELRMYNRAINNLEIDSLCGLHEFPESTNDIQALKKQFSIYPNPNSNGIITVSSEKSIGKNTEIMLLDIQGRMLERWSFAEFQKQELDVSNFVNGIYTLLITVDETRFASKLVFE